jgi:hypothetical protein
MMEFVSWDDDIPNIWKVRIQPCPKPPTRPTNGIKHMGCCRVTSLPAWAFSQSYESGTVDPFVPRSEVYADQDQRKADGMVKLTLVCHKNLKQLKHKK